MGAVRSEWKGMGARLGGVGGTGALCGVYLGGGSGNYQKFSQGSVMRWAQTLTGTMSSGDIALRRW